MRIDAIQPQPGQDLASRPGLGKGDAAQQIIVRRAQGGVVWIAGQRDGNRGKLSFQGGYIPGNAPDDGGDGISWVRFKALRQLANAQFRVAGGASGAGGFH